MEFYIGIQQVIFHFIFTLWIILPSFSRSDSLFNQRRRTRVERAVVSRQNHFSFSTVSPPSLRYFFRSIFLKRWRDKWVPTIIYHFNFGLLICGALDYFFPSFYTCPIYYFIIPMKLLWIGFLRWQFSLSFSEYHVFFY